MVTLIQPKSVQNKAFFDYFYKELKSITPFDVVGRMRVRKSSPSVYKEFVDVLLSIFLLDFWHRMKPIFSAKKTIYLFFDIHLFVHVFFAKITKAKLYAYIHEEMIYGISLSSKLKSLMYEYIKKNVNLIGPRTKYNISLLFQRPTCYDYRNKKDYLLLFGNWLPGKVELEVCESIRFIKDKYKYKIIRKGIGRNFEVERICDKVDICFISDDEKKKLFSECKYIYLPYVPTSQSGVLADCLSNSCFAIVRDKCDYKDYYLRDIIIQFDEIEKCEKYKNDFFQKIYDNVNKKNKIYFIKMLQD